MQFDQTNWHLPMSSVTINSINPIMQLANPLHFKNSLLRLFKSEMAEDLTA